MAPLPTSNIPSEKTRRRERHAGALGRRTVAVAVVPLVGCRVLPCLPGALAAAGPLSRGSAFLWRAQAAGSTGNAEATVGVALLLGHWMQLMVGWLLHGDVRGDVHGDVPGDLW